MGGREQTRASPVCESKRAAPRLDGGRIRHGHRHQAAQVTRLDRKDQAYLAAASQQVPIQHAPGRDLSICTPSAFSCTVAQAVSHQSAPHVRDAVLPCCCCVFLQALSACSAALLCHACTALHTRVVAW